MLKYQFDLKTYHRYDSLVSKNTSYEWNFAIFNSSSSTTSNYLISPPKPINQVYKLLDQEHKYNAIKGQKTHTKVCKNTSCLHVIILEMSASTTRTREYTPTWTKSISCLRKKTLKIKYVQLLEQEYQANHGLKHNTSLVYIKWHLKWVKEANHGHTSQRLEQGHKCQHGLKSHTMVWINVPCLHIITLKTSVFSY